MRTIDASAAKSMRDVCDHRISPLQAAFSYACVPWPTLGVPPLWGPGGELHGNK